MGRGIKIITGNQGCGMSLCSLALAQKLAKAKGVKTVLSFRLGGYTYLGREKFLRKCQSALGGKG